MLEKVQCPALILHGKDDKLISFQDSVQLSQQCQGFCMCVIREQMTHNEFLL